MSWANLFHQRTLPPTLEKLADNEQSFSEFCNAVFDNAND